MTPAPGVPLRRREFVVPTVVELPRRDDFGPPAPPQHQSPSAQQRAAVLNRPLSTRRFTR